MNKDTFKIEKRGEKINIKTNKKQVNMNVDFNEDSIGNILSFLDEDHSINPLDLDMSIDENVFFRNKISGQLSDVESDSDSESDNRSYMDSDYDSLTSKESIKKVPSIKLRTGKNTIYIHTQEEKTKRVRLPFMQRLYEYCINEKNREWIDFYPSGGVWFKNITKLKDDCLISPYLKIKFTSFRKMLTNYGFTSLRSTAFSVNETVYQHPQFKKDSYEQCIRISTLPEKVKNHSKQDGEEDVKKRIPKRKSLEISDSSSMTSEEQWSPSLPRKLKPKKTSLVSSKELNDSLSSIMEKMNKIKSDLDSSKLSRSEIRLYQQRLNVIKEVFQ